MYTKRRPWNKFYKAFVVPHHQHFFFLVAIFTLLNRLSPSTFSFLVQLFIFSNHCLFKIFISFPLCILKISLLYLLKFYNFTLSTNLSSPLTLPLLSCFSYKFCITTFSPLSLNPSKYDSQQKSQYSLFLSLSLSLVVQFLFLFLFFIVAMYHFFPLMAIFLIVD